MKLKPRKIQKEEEGLDFYLKEIGKTPLLKAEEEVELAKKIKIGDEIALKRLVKANLRFVVSVAKQYQNQGLSLNDLINEGNIGLIKAAKRFDETRGWKFISYAVWWIRQAILAALAEQSRIVRLPLNRVGTLHKINKLVSAIEQELGSAPSVEQIAKESKFSREEVDEALKLSERPFSLDRPFSEEEENSLLDVLEDDSQPAPDEGIIKESLKLEIERALDTLVPREAEIIRLYFGLNGEKALCLEEIGVRFNLTRERIRQIKEKGVRRLQHASRSKALRQYLY